MSKQGGSGDPTKRRVTAPRHTLEEEEPAPPLKKRKREGSGQLQKQRKAHEVYRRTATRARQQPSRGVYPVSFFQQQEEQKMQSVRSSSTSGSLHPRSHALLLFMRDHLPTPDAMQTALDKNGSFLGFSSRDEFATAQHVHLSENDDPKLIAFLEALAEEIAHNHSPVVVRPENSFQLLQKQTVTGFAFDADGRVVLFA